MTGNKPLAGLLVVDTSDGKGEMCGRYLADLGAEVILVEPPGGASSRTCEPICRGVSTYFATHNANKSSVVIDLDDENGRATFLGLLATADIWIETSAPGTLSVIGLDPIDVQRRFPQLVVVSITDFGQTGPRRDEVATDWVQMAVAGILSRSGSPDAAPMMPPGALAYESASIQAAWATLMAYWNRLESGAGDYLDFSISDAVAQVLDPPFGSIGTAAAATGDGETSQDRSAFQPYPIFPCRDGHVRIVVLAARQWRAIRQWLGEPEALADPELELAHRRYAEADLVNPYIAELFAERTSMELVVEGQRRGVPIAPVLTPDAVLDSEHFVERGAFVDLEVAPGVVGKIPSGLVELDGERAGIRRRAPELGEHQHLLDTIVPYPTGTPSPSPVPAERRLPLQGIRVLDLGVIVMGAESGRLFADQGADVIKVENRAYPDGSRAVLQRPMTRRFAIAQRGKRSFGVDLRSDNGRTIFRQLVEQADVVLSNFKPGTLDKLGIGPSALREMNPRVVVATSSAMGATGPWSNWMGYGPLVRGVSGLTSLWRDAGDDGRFGDSATVYPDHLEARVVDIAVLACLISRRHHGVGALVEASQAEAILVAMSDLFLGESIEPGTAVPQGNSIPSQAPSGVYRCAGDDAWCVINVRDDDDWSRMLEVVDVPTLSNSAFATVAGRIADRGEIDRAVTSWTSTRDPAEVARALQGVGVPAGAMRHVGEFGSDQHLQARGFFRTVTHPLVRRPILMENGLCPSTRMADPVLDPAPLHGEHTRDIAAELLGMTDDQIESAIDAGVLEESPTPVSA
ncbi:CoA transferase [Rhodococcus sp. MEB041]|uniref:CaiB/BaiF CoA transferase family protein n=1 Tax=Rhodococcus sp. MEB041 TaxID=3040323 RepID=UPI00254A02A3|nr:CoA transferase [Rhodococcus sp. MEB041]